jgi:hypothetical protein
MMERTLVASLSQASGHRFLGGDFLTFLSLVTKELLEGSSAGGTGAASTLLSTYSINVSCADEKTDLKKRREC